jgi:CrcB protein
MAHVDRRELAAVFLGGILGTLLRVWLSRRFATQPADWPWVTFAINVSGCFALGGLAAGREWRSAAAGYRRPLLGTGFCGAYTTFSTVQIEILRMIDHSRYELATGYALASVVAGYLAIQAGTTLLRRVEAQA